MKFGVLLHQERGADAVLREARLADEQGFDSVWLFDHLMSIRSPADHGPGEPLETFTLLTAVGAVTHHVRLAFAMLNLSFRHPPVLAKMLATLDQITHGRVICSIGAGWFEEECAAYDIPFVADHDERIAREREIAMLFKALWTHPAPERTTFHGRYVRVTELPFNPAPYQTPHPPIWVGGDSVATQQLAKELADGWVTLRAATPETLQQVRAAPDWPQRDFTIVRNANIMVGETVSALPNAIVGTPQECAEQVRDIESWGVNYLRVGFDTLERQTAFANTVLPLVQGTSGRGAGH
ncbi:MAG TPA: LLM class flavin-dependent oxidoreductase [Chloroflexota bacterium]|jgi:alkanesulfonate monooxygenase SsuD/methylene tetrahydromethanopterin reductase-like flavin-dependent oxidoreductase (luciferase family)